MLTFIFYTFIILLGLMVVVVVPLLLAHLWVSIDNWLEGSGFTSESVEADGLDPFLQWLLGVFGPLILFGVLFGLLCEKITKQKFWKSILFSRRNSW